MLLNILQWIGQSPHSKELFGPNVNGTKNEKPFFAKGSDHLYYRISGFYPCISQWYCVVFSYHLWWKHLAWKFICLKNTYQEGIFKMKHGKKRGSWQICFHVLCPYNAAAAAKLLQSCPTLCDPTDGSPPGSHAPGILQARTLEWVAISFSSAWKWKVKVKSLSCVWLFATPGTAAYQAPPSMGFSRQEYWSGVPLPSTLQC